MVKATYKGKEVISVMDYDEVKKTAWFVVNDHGSNLLCWAPMRSIVLEEE